MTEAEWLACRDPTPMLELLHGKASDRKLRLFGCATAPGLMSLFGDRPPHDLLEAIERCADAGSLDVCSGRLTVISSPMLGTFYGRTKPDKPPLLMVGSMVRPDSIVGLIEVLQLFNEIRAECYGIVVEIITPTGAFVEYSQPLVRVLLLPVFIQEDYKHYGLPPLRDIFGNPFRPVSFDPCWRTSTAVSLAQGMYDSRDFSAMPILADALQDAGCEHADILTHCRDEKQVHVRGCWVVDLVLGKE
ncbi:MAG: hypothetical protein C0467_27160 [Planctomycetaceae bacterium]|nr:hypothetical protein [Planctomycetaceae bacterium]